jgi:hypothetical protein
VARWLLIWHLPLERPGPGHTTRPWGRNTLDIRDEIRLTDLALAFASSRATRSDQVGQRPQVLNAKARAPPTDAQVRIGRHEIRPSHRHRAEGSVWALDGDAVVPPELLGDDEPERLAPQGVERVDDPD